MKVKQKERPKEIIGDNLKKETKTVLTDKKKLSKNKLPIGMKIAIGILAIIILGLLGYIMYQVGKGSTMVDNGNDLITEDRLMGDSNDNKFTESIDTVSRDVDNTTSIDGTNNTVDNSNVQLSDEDMDKLSSDINKLSTEDDEFEEIQDTFDEGL